MIMTTFEKYRSIPLDYSTIESHLMDLKFPKDKISKMEKTGDLIRLKKGKYLITKNLKDNPPSLELIANHLYGPSYVSFETALSNQGLIPERTYLIKSAISKRKKTFHTPLGSFEYIRVPERYYSVGVMQYQRQDQYTYLIASPEKALCDVIITTKGLRIQSFKAMHSYLTEDLRLETDNLRNMSSEIVREAEEFGYKKKELLILREVIEANKL
jgi:predicted transcriptional regulator of viral defense system